jgi:ATP-binding cassette, subfamily B, bacterial
MGFFDGLNAEQYDRKYADRYLIKRISVYFRPHTKRLALIVALVITVSLVYSMLPVTVSRGVDLLGVDKSFSSLLVIPGLVILISVLGWGANWGQRRLLTRMIADVLITLAGDAFKAAASHDLSFYDQFSSGKVVSRITSDTQDFGQLVNLITDVTSQFLEAAVLAIILTQIDWRLSLYLYALIPVVFLIAISFRSLARKATQQGMRAMATVNATIKETVSGIAIAKNFRQEASIYRDFDSANRTSYGVNVRRGLVLAIVFPTLNALGGLATGIMVYVGGLSAAQGLVTAGAWYLFLQSLDRFLFPIMNLSTFWTQVQNGLSAAERVFALIDAEPAVVQTGSVKMEKVRGKIDFDDVGFFYKETEPVLDHFDLHIKAGETIALVGHTGAGKSSIAKLIARFYEFQSGAIRIDGQDIRALDLKTYRRQLGIVSQAPFLFSGTVAENIRYAAPEISDAEIERMAHKIGDGEWLETLPQGLRTEAGERGARLSMGQRQLVSLMRVLVQEPAIFVLDEATASIDPFTEWQIQRALEMILEHSTSIMIAHRLSTVKSADRIIVMRAGKIIEEGSHQALLAAQGHYAELYNTYFRHQSLEYVEQAGKLVVGEASTGVL